MAEQLKFLGMKKNKQKKLGLINPDLLFLNSLFLMYICNVLIITCILSEKKKLLKGYLDS